MKKVLVSICLFLLSMFSCVGYCAEKLTDDGYGLITTSVSKSTDVFTEPYDIVRYLSGMESEFSDFINKNNSKEQNSKLFGIYMQNLYALRNKFFEYVPYSDELQEYSIRLEPDEDDDSYYHFTYPYVDNVKLKLQDGFEFAFDYKGMKDKYSSYLDNTWNTYLKYSIEQENDYIERLSHDGDEDYAEIYMRECNKWIRKWSIFLTFHPDFPLSEQIQQEINDLESVTQKKFNVGIYILYLSLISLLIIALIGIVIFLTIKFKLINKLKTASYNIAKNVIEKIVKFKTIIFIILGIIILVVSGIYVHNAVSVPKCDSKFAEETVIQIFKQNELIYQKNEENVSDIKMSNFAPISYDKGIKKYSCEAKLTMYAYPDSPIIFLGAYKSFKYNVYYELYKERGKNTAKASWSMLNIGKQERVE